MGKKQHPDTIINQTLRHQLILSFIFICRSEEKDFFKKLKIKNQIKSIQQIIFRL